MVRKDTRDVEHVTTRVKRLEKRQSGPIPEDMLRESYDSGKGVKKVSRTHPPTVKVTSNSSSPSARVGPINPEFMDIKNFKM